MGKRLNPPPGWPEPPGWKPPPGRRPDPSWPDPPAGWQLWVNEGGSTGRKVILGAAVAGVALLGGCTAGAPTSPAPTGPVAGPSATPDRSVEREGTSPAPERAPAPERSRRPGDVPDEAQKVRVARVVDGDTLEVAAIAAGAALSSTSQVDVRLLEIDTPETKHPSEPVQCYGKQATRALRQLLPPGTTAWAQRDQELRDQYGRYLLYLWNDDGAFVNFAMVNRGYAKAALYEPNDRYWNAISAAQTRANSAGKGLWGACAYFGEPAEHDNPPPPPAGEREQSGGGSYPAPPPPPDRDCSEIDATDFEVRPGDPHRFDSDGDGIGCES